MGKLIRDMSVESRSGIEEELVKEHRIIVQEMSSFVKRAEAGEDPALLRREVDDYYEQTIRPHVKKEEEDYFNAAKREDYFLDEEAFRFAHENLEYHLREMVSGAPDPDPVREIRDFVDLVAGHFEEEEHHLFTNDMEEIMDSSGPE